MRRLDADPDRIDWFRVLVDLNRAGLPTSALEQQLGIPRTTILGWKQGAEPRYADGESLLDLWGRALGRAREGAPRQGR